jgi:glutamine amidotransferase
VITIVDYNMGNLGSILNMLKKIGAPARISASAEDIASAGRLILPGVGAFDAGMENLERSGLVPLLERRVREDRVPTLGICLGMQLMTRRSARTSRGGGVTTPYPAAVGRTRRGHAITSRTTDDPAAAPAQD